MRCDNCSPMNASTYMSSDLQNDLKWRLSNILELRLVVTRT